MSDYIIQFTAPSSSVNYKPPFTVVDGTLNTTDTALALCGHNYPNYGVTLWTNMVHLLENFCSNTYPVNNTRGQLWYDSANSKLMVYDGTDYVYISGNDNLTLTEANLDALLAGLSPPYYDGRYVKRDGDTGVGSLEFDMNQNLTLTGTGTVKTSFEPVDGEDVVNRAYIGKLFSYLGYNIDNFGTAGGATMYLELSGGKMKPDANITFEGSGTVKVNDSPVDGVDVVNKSYADDSYVSFAPGPNTKSVANLTMSGPLTLYPDSCNLADDSLQAVPAQWVTDKIKAALSSQGPGTGLYIPITATGTTVSNNLTFGPDKWIKVDLDAATWATDNTLVLNKKQADTLYVKKTGDSLTAHPFTFTQPATQPTAAEEKLDALNVPTAGWVNHRIADAVAAGGGGSTVTKLSTYGAKITIPGTQNTEPTSPSQTITLTIPSNTTAIDYEIRFGAIFLALTSKTAVKAKWIVKANGSPVYTVASINTTGFRIVEPNYHSDEVHSFKYSVSANTTITLTIELYAYVFYTSGTFGWAVPYDIQQWVIADPLSATVAIQATNAPPAGSVTSGPAGNVTYVDFGNGMVMVSGITYCTLTGKNKFGDYTTYYMYTDVTFPNNIQLKLPYDFSSAMNTPSGALATLTPWVKDPANRAGGTASAMTSTGFNLSYAYGAVGGGVDSRLKNPLTYPIYWTVTGFKA